MNVTIIKWEQNTDLRAISWLVKKQPSVVAPWAKKLQDGQAVLFSNCARTRFRLLAKIDGQPVILLPPSGSRALYTQVAKWMLREFGSPNSSRPVMKHLRANTGKAA